MKHWGPVVVWAGLIFVLSGIPGLRVTEEWWDFEVRKLAHMAVFGVLAVLIERALAETTSLPDQADPL